ncbi:MAG: DUF1501 domain-containing protein [Planctomycetota bacterium]
MRPTPDPIRTRREFLRTGLSLVGLGLTVPAFIRETVGRLYGGDDAPPDGGNGVIAPIVKNDHEKILVILQLAGGNDGLNTVVPYNHDVYKKVRPNLALPADQVLKINDQFGLHPSAAGLKSLYDDGLLAIVHGVGYPNPDRSHFSSTDIWELASPQKTFHEGWVGRFFDHECKGNDPINPESAIALTRETPLTLRGSKFQPVSFTQVADLDWKAARNPYMARAYAELKKKEQVDFKKTSQLAYLQRIAMDAEISADQIQTAAEDKTNVEYPKSKLADSFQMIARMIHHKMPTRVYYAYISGFDTHAGQLKRQADLWEEVGASLRAFVTDLKQQGNLDRTMIMTFSEFGRRVMENASGGTDHGAAAPLFVIGSQIKPGLHGTFPDMNTLERGDLKFTTDFRNIYADMIGTWLGGDAKAILGDFAPLGVVKA